MSNTSPKTIKSPTLASLMDLASDPVDALKLAADLSAHRGMSAVAHRLGSSVPPPPKPRSRAMRAIAAGVRDRVHQVAVQLTDDELRRLKRVGPAIARQLELSDPAVAEALYKLVAMEPTDAVKWMRDHLDEIEARFAS